MSLAKDGFVSFVKIKDLDPVHKGAIKKIERKLKRLGVMLREEAITGVIEEEGFSDDILQVLEDLQEKMSESYDVRIEVHSRAIYDEIFEVATSARMVESCGSKIAVDVNTKYKTATKKLRPRATQLPPDTDEYIK